MQVLIRWTVQKGVCVIPGTSVLWQMFENRAAALEAPELSDSDLDLIDALDINHPHYFE